MKIIKKLIPFGFLALPFVAAATAEDVGTLIDKVQGWVNSLLPLLVGITVLVLIVGIIRYITAGEDEERRGKARNLMIYGIIGLFVMVSIWGLVSFLGETLGIKRDTVGSVDGLIPKTPIIP